MFNIFLNLITIWIWIYFEYIFVVIKWINILNINLQIIKKNIIKWTFYYYYFISDYKFNLI